MNVVKAMILEDSRLARLELKSQLNKIEFIELVGEAENVSDGVQLFNQKKPELIFLDIDLPDGNGFDFLAQLEVAPKVIFTTAFEQYALQAFDQSAVDYVLKPITAKRLESACNKLMLQSEAAETSNEMTLDSQFFVKDGNQCWLVQLSQVERFEAMGNYTRVYFEGNTPLVYRTLSKIESRLPEDQFFRVSRQNIVQLKYVVNVEPCASGRLELTLKSGQKIEISRRQTSVFKSLLML
jgi:two-component system LytT family response regulator